ncbi:MAG: hypothetical protein JNN20_02080 [Betaproteobacteria bacterium]|nr:hypothetical protein [Betaproteobacteria bacterium]
MRYLGYAQQSHPVFTTLPIAFVRVAAKAMKRGNRGPGRAPADASAAR